MVSGIGISSSRPCGEIFGYVYTMVSAVVGDNTNHRSNNDQ